MKAALEQIAFDSILYAGVDTLSDVGQTPMRKACSMAQFTEMAILDTFVRLLDEMPLDRITVRDMIAVCGISRSTFYYHFRDIYAVFEAVLRRDVQKLQEKYQREEDWYDNLKRLFTYLSEHRRRVCHIYRSVHQNVLEQYLFQATESLFLEYIRTAARDLIVSEEDIRFICFSYQSMFAGMLLHWLRHGMHEDPIDFLDRARRLLTGNTRRMLEANHSSG